MQFYDNADGQYEEKDFARTLEEDKKALSLVYFFGLDNPDLIFHWPVEGLHDDEYCTVFVKHVRKFTRCSELDAKKCSYLMTYNPDKDKSSFLMGLGYSLQDLETLKLDILTSTDLGTLQFAGLKHGCLKCIAKTTLSKSVVTTVWELKKDFGLRFITLIPGGDKKWR